MRLLLGCCAWLLLVGVGHGDDTPKATRLTDEARATFPAPAASEGGKLVIELLGACHDISDGTVPYSEKDVRKALQKEHVRVVFPKPIPMTLGGKKQHIAEVVFAEGVLWVTCAKEVVRCSKYGHVEYDRFNKWARQTLTPDR